MYLIRQIALFTTASCQRLLYSYKTALLHGLFIEFLDWYIYEYMYCWEIRNFCVTVWFYFFWAKCIFMTLVLFIHCVPSYVWKWHDLFVYSMYDTEEKISVKKTSFILFVIKEKHVFIIVRETNTSGSPLISILNSHFFRTFIYLMRFQSVSIFIEFILFVRVYAIVCV